MPLNLGLPQATGGRSSLLLLLPHQIALKHLLMRSDGLHELRQPRDSLQDVLHTLGSDPVRTHHLHIVDGPDAFPETQAPFEELWKGDVAITIIQDVEEQIQFMPIHLHSREPVAGLGLHKHLQHLFPAKLAVTIGIHLSKPPGNLLCETLGVTSHFPGHHGVVHRCHLQGVAQEQCRQNPSDCKDHDEDVRRPEERKPPGHLFYQTPRIIWPSSAEDDLQHRIRGPTCSSIVLICPHSQFRVCVRIADYTPNKLRSENPRGEDDQDEQHGAP
mmetsp:Transcript_2178/g.5046  ORF Transcript_2178/g.5046 Transcript_2178/m.5046 type:complete len:273 (+) Transcript_2178:182-1000(+)